MICVLFENLDPFFVWDLFDRIRVSVRDGQRHLSDEFPFFRHTGQFFDFIVDEGIVMLEVDA
mgnify:CR=1 FL=1